METKQMIYQGLIVLASNGEEDDLIGVMSENTWSTQILAEVIEQHIREHGDYLSVRYYTSTDKVEPDNLEAALMESLYGEGDADYGMHYSDLTGYLWTDEELKVGGHDLLSELRSHLGKWLYMIVDYSHEPQEAQS